MTASNRELAEQTLVACAAKHLTIATVESCTGGLVAAALTDIPGSSAVFERGFLTYSNAAKTELVGVPATLIEAKGAVSPEVARAMAEGGLANAPVDLSVAITGIAGPGGSAFKPEGLVYFHGSNQNGASLSHCRTFGPIGRSAVRKRAVAEALALLTALAEGHSI